MIREVRSNNSTFRTVSFRSGFNVVLADRTDSSTAKDSRNGVGKSLLLEIIHFCLGGSKGTSLKKGVLKEWEFSLDIEFFGAQITVSRSLGHPGKIRLEGDLSVIPDGIDAKRTLSGLEIRDVVWNRVLGEMMFGLPSTGKIEPFTPSFRSLFPFFARSGREAFADAFRHHRHSKVGDRQICNAYLLDLGWRFARQWQVLREKGKLLSAVKAASSAGVAGRYDASLGELEAERVRSEQLAASTAANLAGFRVHPEYDRIEGEANELTSKLHELANENVIAAQLVRRYEKAVEEERLGTDSALLAGDSVDRIYAEAGASLPGMVKKRIEEVREFHRMLVMGRRAFLGDETSRLRREIADRRALVSKLDAERAQRLDVLRTHGALAEYSRLQNLHTDMISRLEDVRRQINELREIEEGRSTLKIELETLRQTTRRDLNERDSAREIAISLFNANSEALYDAPGNLIIDLDRTGYKFDVEIERAGATGIENMKVFCYDLMLAQLWSQKKRNPGVLIHDSPMFHGVDERQKVLAWKRALAESQRYGFQYICMINSDEIPDDNVLNGLDVRSPEFVRVVLTDRPDGCLLGFRF